MSKSFAEVANFYDAMAPNYGEVSLRRRPYLSTIDRILSRTARLSSDSVILDVGCGDGRRLKEFTREINPALFTIEGSLEMRRRAAQALPKATHLGSSLEATKLPRDTFSHVFALWNVLGHVNNIRQALEQIFESLRPGGLFAFDVHSALNIKQYGLHRALSNFLYFRILKQEERTFVVEISSSRGWVTFYNPLCLRKTLIAIGYKNVNWNFVNYNTGREEKDFWSGQILIQGTKPYTR